jgi:hypothetical protein
MSAQNPRAARAVELVFALLVLNLGIGAPASTAGATDCLTAPNSTAPENSHWFYRTDRAQQRKCWYLRGADQSYSLTDFKDFIAQRLSSDVSDKDVEKLYADFLEWRRRATN